MRSLQGRLILGVAAVFAVGFMVSSFAIYGFYRSTMISEFDRGLRSKAEALAALTEETMEGVRFDFSTGSEEFTRADIPNYYELWLDGKVLTRSPHLDQGDLLFGYGSFEQPQYASVVLPDGRPGRQVCITYQPKWLAGSLDDELWDDDDWQSASTASWQTSSDPALVETSPTATPASTSVAPVSGIFTLTWEPPERRVTLAVARATTDIEQRLASLLWILPTVGGAITLLSSAVLVLVVRRELKPVESVTRAITAIDENSLSDRVPTQQVPLEIAPMVVRLNELLERLENAFHRERSFSSNLAHELRTPLSGLKSTLEVYLSRPHQPQEYQEALQTCLEICRQSQGLVENLLSLARVEAPDFICRSESISAEDVFRECWQPLAEQAVAKQLVTDFEVAPHVVHTDREMLRVILRNVLSNAVSYCDPGGTVEVRLDHEQDTFTINVRNSGNHLPAEQASKVFDRLWRGDQARAQTGEHFGLGLTLTKRFAEALGGSARVVANEMFHIRISLPAGVGHAPHAANRVGHVSL